MTVRSLGMAASALLLACVSACTTSAVAKAAPVARCEEVDPAAKVDPDAIAKSWKNPPPIALAMGADRHERLRALLARGEDPNVCLLGSSPLAVSATGGDLEEVRILLDGGATPDRPRNSNGGTPLLDALEAGQYAAARLLIERGADVRVVADGDMTALYALADAYGLPEPHPAQVDMARALIDHGAAVDTPMGRQRITPLMIAAIRGHVDLVRLLLAHGADPRSQDGKGRTALTLATTKGHADVAQVLSAAMASAASASSSR